jgi:hypothetical protein
MIRSRRVRWVGHVGRMGERETYIVIGKKTRSNGTTGMVKM